MRFEKAVEVASEIGCSSIWRKISRRSAACNTAVQTAINNALLVTHTGRVAHLSGTRKNILGDHAASTDDRIVAHSDAWKDDGTPSDPDVAPDANRTCGRTTGSSCAASTHYVAWS